MNGGVLIMKKYLKEILILLIQLFMLVDCKMKLDT